MPGIVHPLRLKELDSLFKLKNKTSEFDRHARKFIILEEQYNVVITVYLPVYNTHVFHTKTTKKIKVHITHGILCLMSLFTCMYTNKETKCRQGLLVHTMENNNISLF